MILSRIIGTVKNEDGTIKTKGKISLFSVFIGSSPAKGAYCIPKSTKTPFEVYNNFLLENAPVNTFKQLEYLAGDTMNSTGVYDSYLLSTTITSEGVSTFDSTSKVKWFDPEDKSLYRTKTGAPAPGEWPSPVFIETPRGNVILISEDSSFTKYYEYAVKTHVTDIYNLIPGKHYFYRILEGSNIVKTGEFDTKGLVRMIRLNALRNVRDCGGWPTVDGENRFKYGIIFRGSALGFFVDDSINTAANRALDLSILENDFGVTGEVDLNGDLTIDPFYVGHNNTDNILSFSATCYYGMPTAYSQFYNVLNFILLKVANGGAVYVHCELGRDRTGSFVSVIQALCGICDDGITKDYEITTFWGKGTYRYYLEHNDTQNASRSMWKEFASSGTTQERVLSWFRNNYVANSIGNKSTADEAIDYIKSLLLESILQQEELSVTPSDETTTESTLTVLGGYNISSVLDDNGTTTSIPAKNGKSILTQSNNLTLTTTPSLETVLGYSKINGEIITNPFSIDRNTIVTPKILGNLLYNNRSGKRWTIDTTNYRVNATTTTGFYAMEPIPVVHGLSLTFYFPTRANQSVSFEILHTTVAGRFFTYDDYYANNQKAVTLNLNSEGKADYTVEGLTGFTFCNFATVETTGFTTFTAAEVKKILAKYKNTAAWSVPTFNFEKVIDDVGRITLSMVYYQGYLVVFYTNISPVKIVDLANKTVRTVSGSVKNTDIHANAAHLLPIKYSEEDYFPMILVGEENCRVVRLVGSDPATVTASTICTWRIEAQESESSIYDSGKAHGDTLVVGNELYTIKDSSSAGLWKTIDFDLSNINNYVDRVKGTNPIYATKITDDICGGNYGLDCTSFLVGSKKYLAYSYGPIPLYWESGNYFLRWGGLILADFDTKKTIGYLPIEGLGCLFSEHEPDGVAYAGDNTFYLLFNAPSAAPVYKFTMVLPETS